MIETAKTLKVGVHTSREEADAFGADESFTIYKVQGKVRVDLAKTGSL